MFDVETRRVMAQPRWDATAVDYVLLARSLNRTEPDTLRRAQEEQKLFEEALRRDPNLVPALIGLSGTLESELYDDMHADRARLVARIDEVTRRAVNLNPAHPVVLLTRARALALLGHWDSALEAIAMGTRLDPNSVNALTQRAWLMSNMGRPGDALKLADQAMVLDPANSFAIGMACDSHVLLGQYEQAIAACEKMRALSVNERWPYYDLIAAYTQLGDKAKAENVLKEVLRMAPDVTIAGLKNTDSTNADYLRLADQHFYSALRRAGIPEQ